ncbi:hypothetical protein [Methylotuvimicrobium sp.]
MSIKKFKKDIAKFKKETRANRISFNAYTKLIRQLKLEPALLT